MTTFDSDPFGSAADAQVAAPMPVHSPGPARSRKFLLGALIGVAVVAIAAVAFATMNAGRSNDGSESPEAAMDKFFAGLSGENLVAAVDAFLPGEADPVIGYAGSIGSELKRLGILSDDVDPQAVGGVDFEFSGLTYRSEEIAPGFVRVHVIDGEALVDVDQADLPLGELVLDNLPPEMRTELNGDLPAESSSMAGSDFYMVAVEEDGGWYLSFWYTVMDAIFSETGYGTPSFGAGIAPIGAESPEAAVEEAFRRLLSLDLEGLIGMLPPTEMRALYDYMPLVMDDYDQTVGALGSFVSIELASLSTSSSDTDTGARRVKIESFDITFDSVFLEIDGAISYDGACFDVTINDQGGALGGFGTEIPDHLNSCDPDLAGGLGAGLPEIVLPDFLGEVGAAETGVVAVEEGGRWYVSPIESVGDAAVATLRVWDRDTLQAYVEWIIELGLGAGSDALF